MSVSNFVFGMCSLVESSRHVITQSAKSSFFNAIDVRNEETGSSKYRMSSMSVSKLDFMRDIMCVSCAMICIVSLDSKLFAVWGWVGGWERMMKIILKNT